MDEYMILMDTNITNNEQKILVSSGREDNFATSQGTVTDTDQLMAEMISVNNDVIQLKNGLRTIFKERALQKILRQP